MVFSFKGSFEFRESVQARRIELADPAFGDLVDRHGIDKVQLFTTVSPPGHEIGLLKNRQMLRHRLAGHVQSLAQLAERLTISEFGARMSAMCTWLSWSGGVSAPRQHRSRS